MQCILIARDVLLGSGLIFVFFWYDGGSKALLQG
jgi:hypothetical protein